MAGLKATYSSSSDSQSQIDELTEKYGTTNLNIQVGTVGTRSHIILWLFISLWERKYLVKRKDYILCWLAMCYIQYLSHNLHLSATYMRNSVFRAGNGRAHDRTPE